LSTDSPYIVVVVVVVVVVLESDVFVVVVVVVVAAVVEAVVNECEKATLKKCPMSVARRGVNVG
jgi:hypothetical protein